uniref:TGF-beta family profile domain-containing protein n=1 Tax=Eptatretus burgeri TaxID=7764 RepID=A0A8C4QM36_EPTBU
MGFSVSLFLLICTNLFMYSVSCKPVQEGVILESEEGPWGEETKPETDDFENLSKDYGEDREVDMDALVESMKQEFLAGLNLSDIPPHDPENTEPAPQYMLDLYQRFANDRSSMPSSNVVRSFQCEEVISNAEEDGLIDQNVLQFNLSIPAHEHITMAELRFSIWSQSGDRAVRDVTMATATVYEVFDEEGDGSQMASRNVLSLLISRHLVVSDTPWHSFDVTLAVRRWARTDRTRHHLEVHLISGGHPGSLSLGREPGSEPLLLVFSDDRAGHGVDEVNELVAREKGAAEQLLHDTENSSAALAEILEEVLDVQIPDVAFEPLPRTRRHAKRNFCKRTSLYVNFKEIGWDSWIIAPPGYEAYECTGQCHFPLTDHLSPTKHAIVKTLMHLSHPERVAKACCVPTKLDSISILYRDKAGVFTYKYKYEGMMVAECGCR